MQLPLLAGICAAEKSIPNIVLILADDLGYGDLGCFGSEKIKTPHLDKMATEGLKLTSFYAQAVCGPSRAALMTGCYPIRVAEPGNQKSQHTILHSKEITIAEVLRGAGYATGCAVAGQGGADRQIPRQGRSRFAPKEYRLRRHGGNPR